MNSRFPRRRPTLRHRPLWDVARFERIRLRRLKGDWGCPWIVSKSSVFDATRVRPEYVRFSTVEDDFFNSEMSLAIEEVPWLSKSPFSLVTW